MLDPQGDEVDMKKMAQEELKEETKLDMNRNPMVNDAEGNSDLTIKDNIDEVPEAAEVGFDSDDSDAGEKE